MIRRWWYRLVYRDVPVSVVFDGDGERHDFVGVDHVSGHTGLKTSIWVRRWEGRHPKPYVYNDQFMVAGGEWTPRSFPATEHRDDRHRLIGLSVNVPAPKGTGWVLSPNPVFYVDDVTLETE